MTFRCACHFLAALAVELLLAGCSERRPVMAMVPVDAGTPFSLSIPKNHAAVAVKDGVRVYLPARERSRSALSIMVSTASKAPDWQGTRAKRIGMHDVHYAIYEEEGGSGGTALHLVAWTIAERRYVLLESVVQPDVGGDGEFRAEWAILGALR
ncbi:MAG TPA: Tsi3 family protein [Polyangiales bacterium]|nr:Tsi3 family protein [Polyangiales bacterium]